MEVLDRLASTTEGMLDYIAEGIDSVVFVRSCNRQHLIQEASNRNNNFLPPPWAIVALIVLGFNEFMTLLRNPLYIGIIFVAYLLFKALWVQLDISGEFRNGALPGLLSLSTKFLPTVMNLLKKLAEAGQNPASADGPRNPALESRSSGNSTQVHSDITSSASSNVTSSENGIEYSSSLQEDKVK